MCRAERKRLAGQIDPSFNRRVVRTITPSPWRGWLLLAVALWMSFAPAAIAAGVPRFFVEPASVGGEESSAGPGLHIYLYANSSPISGWDPSGHSFILQTATDMAIRAMLGGMAVGSVSAAWTYAKTGSISLAVQNGIYAASVTALATVSPLAAWTLGTAGLGSLAVDVALGEFSGGDAAELASYVAAGVILQLIFKSPAYNMAQTKTVIKFELPNAVRNLKAGNSTNAARNAKWAQAVNRGDEAAQGSLLHAELADLMGKHGMTNLKVEVSYDAAGSQTYYGARGSVRLDYQVVGSNGQTFGVFDLKPTDMLNANWVAKVAARLSLTADDIRAISYEAHK